MRKLVPAHVLTTLMTLLGSCAFAQNPYLINLPGNEIRESLDFVGNQQSVQVCELKIGQTYQVWAIKPGCQPTAKLAGSTAAFATSFEFEATSTCMLFDLKKDTAPSTCSKGTVWFSIACKNCKKKGASPFSKINITSAQTPEALIEDIFVGGACYEISNLQAIGEDEGRGSFNDGSNTIGLDSGVILSTGDVTFAEGPNNDNDAGINIGGPTSDPDLNILAGNLGLYDVQGIEFDFTPTADTVHFQYVFASEEYCEYVNQGVSDFFGFFISGPGINGGFSSNGENIALVPNSNMYVSIDNVSHLTNSNYFVPNQVNCGGLTNMTDIQFDGWTVTLTASMAVTPCETYHLRLMIADVGDGIYDSAIFLGSGTFSAGGNTGQADILTPPGPYVAYESCDDGAFVFSRGDGNSSQPLTLEFNLLPSSTAILGVDYDTFPLTLTIPAFETNGYLPVNLIADGLPEGVETINLSLANGCNCNNQIFTLEILDPPALLVTLPDLQACEGTPTQVQATPSGGVPGTTYTYLWSSGETDSIITITPITDETISVTVTDECGSWTSASTDIDVLETPTATLVSGGGNTCLNQPNSQHTLVIEFTGVPNWLLNYSLNGIPQTPILVTASPYLFTTSTEGHYQLTGVSSVTGNCTGTAIGEANIFVNDLVNQVQTTPLSCSTVSTITVNTTGGTTPYSYDWGTGLPDAATISGLMPGTYTVTVTDVNGCSATASGTITEVPALTTAAVGSTVDCLNPNGGTINLNLSGGSSPFDFSWSNGLPNTQNQTNLPAGNYTVTITDADGCTSTAAASVTFTGVYPTAAAQANEAIDCNSQVVMVSGQGSQTGNGISYLWSGPGIVGANNMIDVQVEAVGTYQLVVTNQTNGCTTATTVEVEADLAAPTAIATGGTITCIDSVIVISGVGSSSGQNMAYEWTDLGNTSIGNTIDIQVEEGGIYQLLVTNQTNGCTASAQATVLVDEDLPFSSIATPDQLNCDITSVLLDGSGSSSGPEFTYQWFQNGGAIANATASMFNANSIGTYQIVVTNAQNGCTSSSSVPVIGDVALPVAGAQASGQLNCSENEVTLTASVQGNPADFSFDWSSSNGSFFGGTNMAIVTADAPGDYQVVVTNLTNGCSTLATVQVTQSTNLPVVNLSASGNLDCTTTQVQLNGNGSSQGTGISFTWSTLDGNILFGENTLTPTVGAAGTYTLTLFDTNNNCENQESLAVTLDDATPTVLIPNAPTLDCGTTQTTLTAAIGNVPPNADLSYAWSSSDGQFSGPTDVQNPTAIDPGTYILVVTNNENGCSSQASVVVDEDVAAPVAVIATPDLLTCATTTLSLNANGSSTGSSFAYNWSTSSGNFISSDTILNPDVDAPGVYNLLITNVLNNCTTTQQVTVSENTELPDASASGTGILNCLTTELTLSGNGSSTGTSYSYLWSGPSIAEGETTLAPTVNEPGVYQLLVTNSINSCSATATVTVGENMALPLAVAGADTEFSCGSTSIFLSGLGSSVGSNFIYEWTTQNGSIASGTNDLDLEVSSPGIYQLSVTDQTNGCESTDEVDITPDPDVPPIAIAQATPLTCIVSQVTLDGTGSATGAAISYNWSTPNGLISAGETTLYPIVTEPGIYVLTVTDNAANCINTASVIVGEQTLPPPVEAGQAGQLNCITTQLSLDGTGSATGPNFSYLWTTSDGNIVTNDTTLTPTVDEPGTYQLLVTDNFTGCTSTDQVTITEVINAPIAAAAAPGILDCNTTSLNLSGSGSSTGNMIGYAWSTTDGNIVLGGNTISPLVDEPGTYLLTVSNGANGCTQTASVVVSQDIAPPTANANSADQLTCATTTISLDGTGSSTGLDYSYLWTTTGTGIIINPDTLAPIVNAPGTYLLTVTNNVNGCTATDSILVTQDVQTPIASIAQPGLLTCDVFEVELQATASQGVNFNYQWTTVDGNIQSGETTLAPTVDQPGVYFLYVTNNLNGCSTTVDVAVNENIESPTANAGAPFLLNCDEALDYLDGTSSFGSGPLTYLWATTDGELVSGINSATPAISSPGNYQLIVTNTVNGCTDADEVTVSIDGPAGTPNVNQPPCFGDNGSLSFATVSGGETPYLFSIDGGNSFSNQATYPDLEPGVYQLVVQDANGCSLQATATIVEPEPFEIAVEPQINLTLGDSFEINVQVNVPTTEIELVEWFPSTYLSCTDCLNPVITPTTSFNYVVTVTTENGCEDSAPLLVLVDKSTRVYVPNAFSPNSDGINDIFMVYSDPKYPVKIKSFFVFDRWGESVFEYFDFPPNDPAYGWDGFFRGQLMNAAVFVWFAEVEFLDGSVQVLKGDVTLVR